MIGGVRRPSMVSLPSDSRAMPQAGLLSTISTNPVAHGPLSTALVVGVGAAVGCGGVDCEQAVSRTAAKMMLRLMIPRPG
jgi:hypothetical protein